jgi:hypothetical protein
VKRKEKSKEDKVGGVWQRRAESENFGSLKFWPAIEGWSHEQSATQKKLWNWKKIARNERQIEKQMQREEETRDMVACFVIDRVLLQGEVYFQDSEEWHAYLLG